MGVGTKVGGAMLTDSCGLDDCETVGMAMGAEEAGVVVVVETPF